MCNFTTKEGIMTFWEKYQNACKMWGESPSGAAQSIGISRAAVSGWKKGTVKPSFVTKALLTRHFNLPFEFNWDDDEEQTVDVPRKPTGATRIPVYGRVAAGIPIEAITDITDFEDISEEMARSGEFIALRIHGNSMQPRMCENDVIIVRRQDDVENGDTAVVFVNGGDATCKKIKKMADGIMLVSTNPEYEPMYYTNKQINDLPIRILGKVVEIRCKL